METYQIKSMILIISDYNKGFISPEMLNHLVDWFDGPVFVDTKKPMVPPDKAYVKINDFEHTRVGKTTDRMIITRGSNVLNIRENYILVSK